MRHDFRPDEADVFFCYVSVTTSCLAASGSNSNKKEKTIHRRGYVSLCVLHKKNHNEIKRLFDMSAPGTKVSPPDFSVLLRRRDAFLSEKRGAAPCMSRGRRCRRDGSACRKKGGMFRYQAGKTGRTGVAEPGRGRGRASQKMGCRNLHDEAAVAGGGGRPCVRRREKERPRRRQGLLCPEGFFTAPCVFSRQRRECRREWSTGWAGSPAHTRPPIPWAARIPRRRSLRGFCRRCRRKWRMRLRR